MSQETLQLQVEQSLRYVDLAMFDLNIESNPLVSNFSREEEGHDLPGRRCSFTGVDSVHRNIHVYIDTDKKDLKMTIEVNAWIEVDGKRIFTNVRISVLSIPVLRQQVEENIKNAFDKVMTLTHADLDA